MIFTITIVTIIVDKKFQYRSSLVYTMFCNMDIDRHMQMDIVPSLFGWCAHPQSVPLAWGLVYWTNHPQSCYKHTHSPSLQLEVLCTGQTTHSHVTSTPTVRPSSLRSCVLDKPPTVMLQQFHVCTYNCNTTYVGWAIVKIMLSWWQDTNTITTVMRINIVLSDYPCVSIL